MSNETTIVLTKNISEKEEPISGEIDTTKLKPVISVISGKDKGKNFIIEKPVILGRGFNVDVMINDGMISRTHLQISYEKDCFIVEDLNSKNGSYIDDNQIKKVSVIPGTIVNIGNSMLVLSLKSETQINIEKELYQAATIDVLTEVANRSWFMKRAYEELGYAQIKQMPITIIMLDIDHFKKVNDNHGHQAGDHVLQKTATTMQEHIRDNDLLGRYGGEEFIMFLKGLPSDKAYDFAERVREAIQNQQLIFNEQTIKTTISIGICSLHQSKNLSLEELIALADEQLYNSKNNGRNQVSISTI